MNSTCVTPVEIPPSLVTALGPIHRMIPMQEEYGATAVIIESAHGRFVLKHFHGFRCAGAQRKQKVLQALAPLSLPVARVAHYVETTAPDGRQCWLTTEHLPGRPVSEILRTEKDPESRVNTLRAYGQVLARIHGTPAPRGIADGFCPWERALALNESNIGLTLFDETLEILAGIHSYAPAPIRPTLIHGMFTMKHVLLDETHVTGIVGWTRGGVGDPRYDIALALRPIDGVGLSEGEVNAFYEGYGCAPLSQREFQYYSDLFTLS